MMSIRPLEEYLNEFALSKAAETGGVVWKNDDGLQMGIIIGKDANGEKYVIYNKPSLKIFGIQALADFEKGKYCYFDFNRQFHNRHKIALHAFDLLYQYNKYNQNNYAEDFKFELPSNEEAQEVPAKEFSKGLGSVVYRASLLHVLEDKMKTGFGNTNSSVRKGLSDFARQFKESVSASFSRVNTSSSETL